MNLSKTEELLMDIIWRKNGHLANTTTKCPFI